MFGEIFGFIRDVIQFIWPFQIVRQWEMGGVEEFGKFIRVVGPGCWPMIPWFTNIRTISMVPAIVETARQDITLQDGSLLSFATGARVQITDFALAVYTIDNSHQTTQELIRGITSDKLAQVDAGRLAPEKRSRLLTDLTKWVNAESQKFGVTVDSVWFTTFVQNVRTFRLLQDNAVDKW